MTGPVDPRPGWIRQRTYELHKTLSYDDARQQAEAEAEEKFGPEKSPEDNGDNGTAETGSHVMTHQNPVGRSAPPRPSLPSEQQPATRGDIAAVVDELRKIRGVLEEIRAGDGSGGGVIR